MSTASLPGRSRTSATATRECRATIQPLEPRLLMARPAGGGDSIPPGTVYYADYTMVDYNSHNQFPSFTGVYGMKGNGSGKTLVSADFPGDVSRLLHGGRWTLEVGGVADAEGNPATYPNGMPRREIFATPLGGGEKVQLTDDPYVQPSRPFWSPDDSFISFSAVTWTNVGSGGNYPANGDQWLADADVFRVGLTWTTEPAESAPVAVLDVGERFRTQWIDGVGILDVYPDVGDLDWSPDGTRLAYQRATPVPGSSDANSLHVTSFDADLTPAGTTDLGVGIHPEFSPDGSRIAYSAPSPDSPNLHAVWSVSPNGTGLVRLTRTAQMSDYNPGWSPDGKQITFTRHSLPKGYQPGLADVMRMPATGGSPINLTNDLEYAQVIGWRSDVQATTTSSTASATPIWSSGSTLLFSSELVSDSSDSDNERLIDLLGV